VQVTGNANAARADISNVRAMAPTALRAALANAAAPADFCPLSAALCPLILEERENALYA